MRQFCIVVAIGLVWSACGDDDGGTNNSNTNQTFPVCGNGTVELGEACDQGAQNSDVEPDTCRTSCREAGCGDGVLDTDEACDDGGANSDRLPDACRHDCQLPSCGDGVKDSDEGCDDGALQDGDGCSAECRVEPGWTCEGVPSVCTCQDYFHGDLCGLCRVHVRWDATELGSAADGLTWDTAFASAQEGIDQAHTLGAGCEVWVTGGTYYVYDYAVTNTLHMRSGVGLYGGFAGTEQTRGERDWETHPTVLEGTEPGGLGSPEHVFHVIMAVDTDDATIDGFTIAGGWAMSNLHVDDQMGAGIHAHGSRLAVANCTFLENIAGGHGGALYVYAGRLTVSNSTFRANFAEMGGGVFSVQSSLSVDRCSFTHNAAASFGGAVYRAFGDLQVTSSVFFANLATDDAGVGGAVYARGGQVQNSTFVSNYAGGSSAAIDGPEGLLNCLFDQNSGAEAFSGCSDVRYSQVQDVTVGEGNDTADPMIVRRPMEVTFGAIVGSNTIQARFPELFAINDVIELNNDGIPRTVTQIVSAAVSFAPPVSGQRFALQVVEIWPAGATTVDEDLTLQAGSPCIDTGDDSLAPPVDRNGLAWADAWYDATDLGTPGTIADRGAYDYVP